MRRLLFLSSLSLLAATASTSELVRDIEYGQAGGERLLLDVSIPDGEGPFPVAILIHGGGWGSGDKGGADQPNSGADITPWFEPFTEAGFAWFSINYRLAPEHRWPACKDDTLTALAWIKENAHRYKGDPNKIAVVGHSAGGHLAALTAFAPESIRPHAIIGCAAVTDFEQDLAARGGLSLALQNLHDRPQEITPDSLRLLRSTSPINLLQPGLPPFLLVHGDADKTVPIEQSLSLQRRLKVLGGRADLLRLRGAQHRLTEWNASDPEWVLKMTRRIKQAFADEATPEAPLYHTDGDTIHLLPDTQVLPFDSGRSEILFTKTGCTLQIDWSGRSLESAVVTATKDTTLAINYGQRSIKLSGKVGTQWTLDSELTIIETARAFDAYVAADGSGQYASVLTAIQKSPPSLASNESWVIQIAPGHYRELLYVQSEKRRLTLRGYDAAATVLSFDLNANIEGPDGNPIGTFRTPSTTIDADDFTAENLTFENAAGNVGQALAIRLDGDRGIFRNCRFLGWQDTILANKGRHYFQNCYIEGHVDFIFGGATCYFDQCHIHCKANGYITAASTPEHQPYGYVFSNCRITGADAKTKTYLGRPWRPHAAVAYINTSMDSVVRPEGWDNWRQPERERTARYLESGSYGPGASLSERVPWATTFEHAKENSPTPETVLGFDPQWSPDTQPRNPSKHEND